MNGVRPPAPPTNGLAIAGFVCSVLGVLGSCGLLSPIGLILSLVAVGKEPKGFAIAGIVIGALGTCLMIPILIIAIAVPALALSVIAGLGIAGALGPEFVAKIEMAKLAGDIRVFQEDHTMLPLTLDDLNIQDPDQVTDQWGHPYGYELAADGQSYRLYSLGPDGAPGTADDISANPDWVINMDDGTPRSSPSPSPSPPPPPPPSTPSEPASSAAPTPG